MERKLLTLNLDSIKQFQSRIIPHYNSILAQIVLRFGKKSFCHYTKGLPLADCLPSDDTMDWIEIDTKNRTIELRLK